MTTPPGTTQALIDRLVRETGASDAVAAIRQKAVRAIDSFVTIFGEPETFPLDLRTIASFLGIKLSDTTPAFSTDAELAPDGEGGVEIRVNPDRPETRIRFSMGHEITHTFFPDHTSHVWPRADSRYRDLSNPDDYLEMLCDIGAAELVFPRRWFVRDAAGVCSAGGLVALASRYGASRHATLRRFAELHDEAVAAVYFAWKLKPTQKRTIGRPEQTSLLGTDPAAEMRAASRLRIEYTIPSEGFSAEGHFLPKDKSVENDGPIYEAAATGYPFDGECHLDLGQAAGLYRVHAVPLWTPDDQLGPGGENAVAAILRPLQIRVPKKKVSVAGPSLFD